MKPDLRSIVERERAAVRSGEKSFDDFGLQRAYSVLDLKDIFDGDESRTIEGIASTPSTDRMGDVIESTGAVFQVPFPLLWQHDSKQPVGWVTFAKAMKDGIPYKAQWAGAGIADFIDNAWKLVKAKLVRAVSIGFRPLEWKWLDEDDVNNLGIHFLKWEWMELSAVTIPANMDATISNIKSLDHFRTASRLAAHGVAPINVAGNSVVRRSVSLPSVGATNNSTKPKEASTMKTNAEQIASYEAKRAANLARIGVLMGKSNEDGSTLSTAEAEEYETLRGEMGSIDAHIRRLKEYEKMMVGTAEPVNVQRNGGGGASAGNVQLESQLAPASSTPGTHPSNGDGRVHGMRQNDNLPKGTAFVRYVMLLARSKGNHMQAREWAREFDSSTPQVRQAFEAYINAGMQRAAVAPGTTTDPTWAGPLVQMKPMASEFIEYLYPLTILGRMEGFRRVPFNVKMARQTTSSVTQWVGQGAPKPVGKIDFDLVQLGFAKVASIIVLTKDLVKFSDPAAEAVCRTDMAEAISKFLDRAFIDPAIAAVTNVSPASVTHNALKVHSSGSDIDSVTSDVNEIFAEYSDHNVSPVGAYWVMNPRTAQAIGSLRSPLGVFAFPTINIMGGTFQGLPVITSNNVHVEVGTGRQTFAALVKPSEILMADDGGVSVDLSEEASLEMSSTPTGAGQLVSLWQQNLVGIRAEQYINWLPRRDHVVVVWDNLPF
jgi:HK97 family phage major capsid protein/HK97 family phage prohead protease